MADAVRPIQVEHRVVQPLALPGEIRRHKLLELPGPQRRRDIALDLRVPPRRPGLEGREAARPRLVLHHLVEPVVDLEVQIRQPRLGRVDQLGPVHEVHEQLLVVVERRQGVEPLHEVRQRHIEPALGHRQRRLDVLHMHSEPVVVRVEAEARPLGQVLQRRLVPHRVRREYRLHPEE